MKVFTMLVLTLAKKVAATAIARTMKHVFPRVRESRHALWTAAIVLCACAMLYPAAPAQAVEGGSGVYALGFTSPQAGIMPEPGTYFAYNLYYYKGDSTTDVSASGQIQVPGTGLELPAQLTGSVETEVESYAHLFSFTHVFDKELLGGQPGVSVLLPYADVDLTLTGEGVLSLTGPWGGTFDIPLSGSIDESEKGIGDTTLTGLLGWHAGYLHYMAILNVYVPTGEYDKDDVVNVGRNHWAIEPMAAVTYLNGDIGLEVSGAAGITFNLRNTDTDYTSGNEFHLDLAAIQHLSDKFHLGLVGYAYSQLTGDRGSGAPDDFKGRVYAWGPAIGGTIPLGQKHNLYLKARWYNEFGASNRTEGDVYLFAASMNF